MWRPACVPPETARIVLCTRSQLTVTTQWIYALGKLLSYWGDRVGLHVRDGTEFSTVSMVVKALLDSASLSSSGFGLPDSFYLKGRSKKPISPVSKEIRIKKSLEILA